MVEIVALAVVHGDPPHVIVAEDLETLHRRLALELVARTDPARLGPDLAEVIRQHLLDEQWGSAVELWMGVWGETLDVYPSWDLHRAADAEMASAELQFTPLFRDA